MKAINSSVTANQRAQIYLRTMAKIVRGFIKKIFFKKSSGLLFIGKGVSIQDAKNISLGRNVKFEDFSEIQGLSVNGINIGNNVTIGRFTSIRPSSYYGVGQLGKGLEIGNNSSIGPGGYVGCAGDILIGNNVMIGPNVTIIAENHNFSNKSTSIKSQGVSQKGIVIEENVWIGANVTILDGVTIGTGCVIGAATLVTKSVPANSILIDKRNPQHKSRIQVKTRN